jgi:hypothetical protein
MVGAEKVVGVPVVAGCKPPAVLQTAEYALDVVGAFVEGLAEAAFPHARALWRDVRDRALVLDQVADAVGVVGAIGVDDAPFRQINQQMLGRAAVGRLPRRQVEGEWPAVSVGDGVNLGVATAATATHRLRVSPPLPPAAERCAFTCVLSISISYGGPPAAASAAKTSRHTPSAAHRTHRL